jgi:hypothetical protein
MVTVASSEPFFEFILRKLQIGMKETSAGEKDLTDKIARITE